MADLCWNHGTVKFKLMKCTPVHAVNIYIFTSDVYVHVPEKKHGKRAVGTPSHAKNDATMKTQVPQLLIDTQCQRNYCFVVMT